MPTWLRDWKLRPRDVAITVAVAVVQVMGSRGANHAQAPDHPLNAFVYAILIIGPIALLARHRFRLAAFYVTLLCTAAYVLGGYGFGPIFLSLVIAFLTAATVGSRWPTYSLIPLGYLCFVWPLPIAFGNSPSSWWQVIGIAAWLAVLISIAEGIRQRRATLEARRQRAAAAKEAEAEERLRRASDERLAIARELHDVLAHSLSLINVQSSVALELFDAKPRQAREALAAIKGASKDALGEVHALLTSIRSGADQAPTAPTPSIADIDTVVERARSAGMTVATQVDGHVRKLPAVVDVAAARIVQESLTNVARHAAGAEATVAVRYKENDLRIQVDNDGGADTPTPIGSGGNGITGMIERARALGGELSAGRRPGGGFRVSARIPITESPVEES
ncbi:sensor histidine kinase [Antrihabitans cavernicola]|uniref:histidine kinase n=1 Tax=Antrihabitans cavernicola TaxID=2495913 RepID=A0A5A7S9T2_9NOCA|nr:histidine kinase [Spelaeibacter cavernicola]KAA0022039.1 sensor histidine kinase [Spelaeibacter cavernicola]